MSHQHSLLALTLKHPWPYAVCRLGKDVENRNWKPPALQFAKGELFAIHGGVPPKKRSLDEAREDFESLRLRRLMPGDLSLDQVVMPGVVAVVRFGGIVSKSDSPWFVGPFGWLLEDVVVLPEPVSCRGAQGLWAIPDEVLAEVRSGYREGARIKFEGASRA